MDFIEIEIYNWARFNPRKDHKRPTWFALSNRIIESPSIMELSAEEFKAWIYILCQASQRNSGAVKIYFQHAQRIGSISKKTILNTVSKLEKDGSIQLRVPETNSKVLDKNSTDIQTNIHTVSGNRSAAASLHPLANLWNQKTTKLPKVIKTSGKRLAACGERWSELGEADWTKVIERIEKSDFCNGANDRNWRASFDWLLKPQTHIRALEGTYDNRASKGATGGWE